jgi:hypothetical protein
LCDFQTGVSFCIHKYSFAIMGKKNKIKKKTGDKINLLYLGQPTDICSNKKGGCGLVA